MGISKYRPAEIPAFSNQDIYELIHGGKPPGKVQRKWRKVSKLLFRSNDSWTGSKIWHFVGGLSLFFALIPFLMVTESTQVLRHNLLPLQLGGAMFLYLFMLSKTDRDTHLLRVSGVLSIFLAVIIPMLALNLNPTWHTTVLYLPAHFAVCWVVALYRSDENLDVSYIIRKALFYLVLTILTGSLSAYALTNV